MDKVIIFSAALMSASKTFAERIREQQRIDIDIDTQRSRLRVAAGEKLLPGLDEIIQAQPKEKQEAFYGTTVDAILGGADYGECGSIEGMAAVYARWLISKYF